MVASWILTSGYCTLTQCSSCILVLLLSAQEWKNINTRWLFLASRFIPLILISLVLWHSAKQTWRWSRNSETELLTIGVVHRAKSIISCEPVAGLADDNPGVARLIWSPMLLFATANFTTCEAIVSPELTIALSLIFFVLFMSSWIFSSSRLMCSDCSMKTLVNASTFSSTWSSISLSVVLALMDFLVRNKSPYKEGLSAAGFFKFARALGGSKIKLSANPCSFRGFVDVAGSELWAFFVDLVVTKFSSPLNSGSNRSLTWPSTARSNYSSSSSVGESWCISFFFSPSIDNSNTELYLSSLIDHALFWLFDFCPAASFFFPLFPDMGLKAEAFDGITVVGFSALKYYALLTSCMAFRQSTMNPSLSCLGFVQLQDGSGWHGRRGWPVKNHAAENTRRNLATTLKLTVGSYLSSRRGWGCSILFLKSTKVDLHVR